MRAGIKAFIKKELEMQKAKLIDDINFYAEENSFDISDKHDNHYFVTKTDDLAEFLGDK